MRSRPEPHAKNVEGDCQVGSREPHSRWRQVARGQPPLVAKLVLAPTIQAFVVQFPHASVDVWVDDISVDFVGDEPAEAGRELRIWMAMSL